VTRILQVDALHPERSKIGLAARIIRKGGLVAFPTETVYGLGANALDANAVRKIFKAKNRPADNPLIVHINKVQQLEQIAIHVPRRIQTIAEKVWPGPVTFLLYKSDTVPDVVCGNTGKIAVRMPAHPIALALIERSGVPIAAPSANTSTKPSPTNARHVMSDLGGKIDLVLDGGDTFFGVESTIIDSTSSPYTLLRPGAYSLEELRKYFGKIRVPRIVREARESKVAIVPGMKYRHYAPRKPLYMVSHSFLDKSPDLCRDPRVAIICSQELSKKLGMSNPHIIVLGSEMDLYEIARNLFSSFRKLDSLRVKFGLIQTFEEKGIGLAIMNRIKKASTNKTLALEPWLEGIH
jgi:L-threonylcarbamoyladenylate synthase